MKIGFVTCVQLGLSCMEAIYAAGGSLELVVSLNDKQAVNKSGRIYVDEFCNEHEISVLKTAHVNDSAVIDAARQLDWLFIIGWSQIASKELLDAPRKGVLGMHPTLLPEGRGRAAIPWAILKRLKKTGVTLFKLEEEVDAGPILYQYEIELPSNIDATQLYDLVEKAHVKLIQRIIPSLMGNGVIERVQDASRATLWPGRRPEAGKLNLQGSVYDAECLVRAVTKPYPGAFFYRNGIKTTVWKAKVVSGPDSGQAIVEFPDGYLQCLEYDVDCS